jgi:hypothetical protein
MKCPFMTDTVWENGICEREPAPCPEVDCALWDMSKKQCGFLSGIDVLEEISVRLNKLASR